MSEHTKAIIDYAYNDDGVQVRDALYSAIQDKVSAHLESEKQRIAQNLISPQPEATPESQEVENA